MKKKILIIGAVILVIAGAVFMAGYYETRPSEATRLDDYFALSKKEAGTKIYYSENLGVGFTYHPDENFHPAITESGDKLSIGDQSVEVFEKNPSTTLKRAIENSFLKGYNSADCFVKDFQAFQAEAGNYEAAVISFPPATDPSAPWWQNSDKCPAGYSETNSVQYFLMDKDNPGKFMFIRAGQGFAVFDGTPNSPHNWNYSLRVLK